jgi:hypothetical protein
LGSFILQTSLSWCSCEINNQVNDTVAHIDKNVSVDKKMQSRRDRRFPNKRFLPNGCLGESNGVDGAMRDSGTRSIGFGV